MMRQPSQLWLNMSERNARAMSPDVQFWLTEILVVCACICTGWCACIAWLRWREAAYEPAHASAQAPVIEATVTDLDELYVPEGWDELDITDVMAPLAPAGLFPHLIPAPEWDRAAHVSPVGGPAPGVAEAEEFIAGLAGWGQRVVAAAVAELEGARV